MLQELIEAVVEKSPGALPACESLQNGLVDRGALALLERLAVQHECVEAWLGIQALCFRNKRTCALMVKDNHYMSVIEVRLCVQTSDFVFKSR